MSNPFNNFPPPFTSTPPSNEGKKIKWNRPVKNFVAEKADLGVKHKFTTTFSGCPVKPEEIPEWYVSREPIHDEHAFFDTTDLPPLPVYQQPYQYPQPPSEQPEPEPEPETSSEEPKVPKSRFDFLGMVERYVSEVKNPAECECGENIKVRKETQESLINKRRLRSVKTVSDLYEGIHHSKVKNLWGKTVKKEGDSEPGCSKPTSDGYTLNKGIFAHFPPYPYISTPLENEFHFKKPSEVTTKVTLGPEVKPIARPEPSGVTSSPEVKPIARPEPSDVTSSPEVKPIARPEPSDVKTTTSISTSAAAGGKPQDSPDFVDWKNPDPDWKEKLKNKANNIPDSDFDFEKEDILESIKRKVNELAQRKDVSNSVHKDHDDMIKMKNMLMFDRLRKLGESENQVVKKGKSQKQKLGIIIKRKDLRRLQKEQKQEKNSGQKEEDKVEQIKEVEVLQVLNLTNEPILNSVSEAEVTNAPVKPAVEERK